MLRVCPPRFHPRPLHVLYSWGFCIFRQLSNCVQKSRFSVLDLPDSYRNPLFPLIQIEEKQSHSFLSIRVYPPLPAGPNELEVIEDVIFLLWELVSHSRGGGISISNTLLGFCSWSSGCARLLLANILRCLSFRLWDGSGSFSFSRCTRKFSAAASSFSYPARNANPACCRDFTGTGSWNVVCLFFTSLSLANNKIAIIVAYFWQRGNWCQLQEEQNV